MPENDPTFVKRRAPMLYVIIVVKLVKGVALLLLALGVYSLSDNDLPEEFRNLLRFLHLDPERRFFTLLTHKLSTVTPANVLWVAGGTFIYSLLLLVEAIALFYRTWWSVWFVVGASAFFVPIEMFELLRHFTWAVFVVLVLNVVFASYIFVNRDKLFHHHHPH